jgi:hypothetical protein
MVEESKNEYMHTQERPATADFVHESMSPVVELVSLGASNAP